MVSDFIQHCMASRPKSVCILGLGPSRASYVDVICSQRCAVPWEEVWTVNYGAAAYHCDKVFSMHDMENPEYFEGYPGYRQVLKSLQVPLLTLKHYQDFPTSVEFPIRAVRENLHTEWFRTTVAYMVGYAMLIGVEDLYFFGCDFHYPDKNTAEEGAQNVAYFIGIFKSRGGNFHIPESSTLMGANWHVPDLDGVGHPLMYGYSIMEQPFLSPEACKQFKAGKLPINYDRFPNWFLEKEFGNGIVAERSPSVLEERGRDGQTDNDPGGPAALYSSDGGGAGADLRPGGKDLRSRRTRDTAAGASPMVPRQGADGSAKGPAGDGLGPTADELFREDGSGGRGESAN